MKTVNGQCQRFVNTVRCIIKRVPYCADHINVKCTVCEDVTASVECTTCHAPLCYNCQHHGSFGR